MKARLYSYYQRRASTYEELDSPESIVGAVRRLGIEDHLAIIKPEEGELVLDVGTGTGRFLPFFPSCIGADLSENMLKKARVYKKPLVRCDAEHLPFRDNTFDIVHSAGFLGIYRSRKIIEECTRVAKKGGRVYISFPAIRSVSGFFFRILGKFNYNPTLLDEWYTLGEIEELMPENLKLLRVYKLGFEPPFQRLYKNLESRTLAKLFVLLERRLVNYKAFDIFKARYLVEAVKS